MHIYEKYSKLLANKENFHLRGFEVGGSLRPKRIIKSMMRNSIQPFIAKRVDGWWESTNKAEESISEWSSEIDNKKARIFRYHNEEAIKWQFGWQRG